MKRFFRWYWEHIKSAFSFGGYPHPLSVNREHRGESFWTQEKRFWKTEWRSKKSFFIVAMIPQLFLMAITLLLVAYYVLLNQF